jgi:hypothetical protein
MNTFKYDFNVDYKLSNKFASSLRKEIIEPSKHFIDDFSANIRNLRSVIKKEDKSQNEIFLRLEKVIIIANKLAT